MGVSKELICVNKSNVERSSEKGVFDCGEDVCISIYEVKLEYSMIMKGKGLLMIKD